METESLLPYWQELADREDGDVTWRVPAYMLTSSRYHSTKKGGFVVWTLDWAKVQKVKECQQRCFINKNDKTRNIILLSLCRFQYIF